jgi:carbohydrate-binding DOMON domain-containing protein
MAMIRSGWKTVLAVLCAAICVAGVAGAQQASFKDPTGDDFGPGNYVYPTDTVYKAGSFDLTSVAIEVAGKKGTVEVGVNSALEDPWGMKTGFAVQMVFVFIDTDHKEGSGFTDGIPGLNVKFAAADAWDKVIILSPQPAARVRTEVETKAAAMMGAVIVPGRTKGSGRTITGSFDAEGLGGDPATWGYQVVVQSNEGFPESTEVLTRRVNEYEGQHRFGGGNDAMCDPHAMDVLAGKGVGAADEVEAQKAMLKHECNPDGSSKQMAVLTMIRK